VANRTSVGACPPSVSAQLTEGVSFCGLARVSQNRGGTSRSRAHPRAHLRGTPAEAVRGPGVSLYPGPRSRALLRPPRLSRQRRDPQRLHSLQIFGAVQKEGGRGALSSETTCNPATLTCAHDAVSPDRLIGGPFAGAGLARSGCRATRNPVQPRNRRRAGVRPLCVSRCPVRRLSAHRQDGGRGRLCRWIYSSDRF
jgi:hypothetical protein